MGGIGIIMIVGSMVVAESACSWDASSLLQLKVISLVRVDRRKLSTFYPSSVVACKACL